MIATTKQQNRKDAASNHQAASALRRYARRLDESSISECCGRAEAALRRMEPGAAFWQHRREDEYPWRNPAKQEELRQMKREDRRAVLVRQFFPSMKKGSEEETARQWEFIDGEAKFEKFVEMAGHAANGQAPEGSTTVLALGALVAKEKANAIREAGKRGLSARKSCLRTSRGWPGLSAPFSSQLRASWKREAGKQADDAAGCFDGRKQRECSFQGQGGSHNPHVRQRALKARRICSDGRVRRPALSPKRNQPFARGEEQARGRRG